jgi:SAM-dependent methyltransferase
MEFASVMLALLLLCCLVLVFGSLAYGAVSAAPWVPMWRKDIKRLIELAQPKPGEIFFDLGCGDGRMLEIAAKQYGLNVVGFEVAILPYLLARLRLWFKGLWKRGEVRLQNFWKVDLAQADIIACFLTPPAMQKLEAKLLTELKPGARFVTYVFPLPNQLPSAVSKPLDKDNTIYLYTKIVRPVGRVVDI